jgi:hypothetical protein
VLPLPRRLPVRLPALLCALVVAVLSGCSADAADRDPARAVPPAVGDCRVLTPADVAEPSDASPVVDCTEEHTAETFAVGSFPDRLTRDGVDDPRLGGYVYDTCQPKFQRFLGGDESLVMRTTVSWAWFRPSESAWRDGAHWWRCDVVGGGEQSKSYLNLPDTAEGLLLGRPEDEWMVCVDGPTVDGSVKTPCSQEHTWRAVTTIVLGNGADPYPGNRVVEVRTRDFCSDSVGAWLNYPADYDFGYTWFHEPEWKAGNRRSICWARTAE